MRMRNTLFGLMLSLVCVCSVAQATKTVTGSSKEKVGFQRGSPLPIWIDRLSPVPETKSKEPIVIRLHETQVLVSDKPAMLVNRAIQINERTALEAMGQIAIEFFPEYQQLALHRVVLIRDGLDIDKTKQVEVKLIQRETRIEQGLMGGAISAQLLLDDLRVGDTLWFTYTVTGENPVFANKMARSFSWDSSAYVEKRKLVVNHSSKRPLYWRQIGDFNREKIVASKEVTGDIERIRFEENAIEAVEFEVLTPTNFLPVRLLQFSEYDDWRQVGTWATALFPKRSVNKDISKLAQTFATEKDQLSKATAALRWVQEQVRYFSLSLGENSHRPAAPELVLKRRYGDCKDKSYLLVSLLNELGISAKIVLLSTDMTKLPGRAQPSPGIFDHVIVQIKIGQKEYYVDPTVTGQLAQIDQLPEAFPGAIGLLVDGDASSLISISEVSREEIDFERREQIQIKNFQGDALIELKLVYRGKYADYARRMYGSHTKSELRKLLLGMFERRFTEIDLAGSPQLRTVENSGSFEVTVALSARNVLVKENKKYTIDYDASSITNSFSVPEKIIRNYPYSLPSGKFHGRYYIDVIWPETVREHARSNAQKLDNAFFTVNKEFSAQGNHYSLLNDFKVKVDEVKPTEMPALQKSTRELEKFLQGSFQVAEDWISSKEDSIFNFRQHEAMRRTASNALRLAELRKPTSNRSETSKQNLEDQLETCELILETISAGSILNDQFDQSIIELDAILKSEPGKKIEGIEKCKGKLYFLLGRYRESIDLYARSENSSSNTSELIQLAWSYFQIGDRDHALSSLDRVYAEIYKSSADSPSPEIISNVLTLYARMGLSVPEKWVAQADFFNDGPWPRPLIAYQLNKISKLDLLHYVEKFSPDAQAVYQTDLRFYIGSLALARGDRGEALESFAWIKQFGPLFLTNVPLAFTEFKRLQYGSELYLQGLEATYRGDHKNALEIWKKLADQGNAWGHYQMGREYYRSISGVTKKDYPKAYQHFLKASEGGVVDAENFLALMNENGNGVPRNIDAALEWYEKAAQKDNVYSLYNLAEHFRSGAVLKQNLELAIDFYQRAALRGHHVAQFELAKLNFEGRDRTADHLQAYRWATLATLQDHQDATILLAKLLMYSPEISHDGLRAIALLDSIRNQKDDEKIVLLTGNGQIIKVLGSRRVTEATILIGKIFEEGIDVPVDYKKASEWYKKAEAMGSEDAKAYLALLIFRGSGVPQDKEKAIKLLEDASKNGSDVAKAALDLLSAEGGNVDAQSRSGQAFQFGNGVPINFKLAAKWYELAAAKGDQVAINNLGDLYETGNGLPKNYEKAIELYTDAATRGYYMGFVSLGSMLEKGVGVKKNLRLAFVYYKIAQLQSGNKSDRYVNRVSSELSDEEKKALLEEAEQWKQGKPLPLFERN